MLGKLLKYEFKYISKWLVPIYLVALLLAPVARLAFHAEFENEFLFFIPMLAGFAYVVSQIAVSVGSTIIIIYRYYQNMTGEEAYLTHTLPVTASSHLTCKILSGCVWTAIGSIISVVSIFLVVASPDVFSEMGMVWNAFTAEVGMGMASLLIIECVVLVVISLLSNILTYYTSISMGPVLIQKHRLAGAFVSYLIISTIIQVISTVLIIPVVLFADVENAGPEVITNAFFPALILLTGVITIALYFVNRYLVTKRINLD